jgi:hypothetical protein
MGDEKQENRTLTDDDVKAIIDEAFARLRSNVGGVVLGLAWKGAVIGLLILAYFGLKKG